MAAHHFLHGAISMPIPVHMPMHMPNGAEKQGSGGVQLVKMDDKVKAKGPSHQTKSMGQARSDNEDERVLSL